MVGRIATFNCRISMEVMTLVDARRLGAEGVKIAAVGFFAHAIQAGFPRQGLVLQGCVVALHLLGLPMGFLALLSVVFLLGLPMGFHRDT